MTTLKPGLWPVMLTPFTEDLEVDIPALRQLVEFYLETGADGLFANCLSSEMFHLTPKERLLVTQTVVEAVAGRVQVIATGSFGESISEMADFIKEIYSLGVDAVVLSTNAFVDQTASEEALKREIEDLLDKTGDIPLGLYECPVPHKRLLSPGFMSWVASTGRFVYSKDTSCQLDVIKAKLKAIEGTDLGLFNAHTPTGSDSVLAGGRGLSPIGANLYPELFSRLLQETNDNPESQYLKDLNASLSIMDEVIHRDYPHAAKIFLQMRGLNIQTACRIKGTEVNYNTLDKMKALMNTMQRVANELNIELFSNTKQVV